MNLMASTVTGVGHMSNSMASEPRHLWTVHMVLFVHRLLPSLVLLNSSHRYLSNGTDNAVIGILVCLRGYFYFFICFSLFSFVLVICEERGEKKAKKKNIKDLISIPKLWWRHHQYRWKNPDEISPMTLKKITNGEWRSPHELFKYVWVHLSLGRLCDLLHSSFVTFFGIVGFILLISFQ